MNKGWTFMRWYLFIVMALIILSSVCFCSCTENTRARVLGGKLTVELPKGQKLIEATWKGDDNSLWYLTEPMDTGYTPKTKVFQEDSRFGVLEGSVVFVESK